LGCGQLLRDISSVECAVGKTGWAENIGGCTNSERYQKTTNENNACSERSEAIQSRADIISAPLSPTGTGVAPACGIFYGELSSVLQKRSEKRPEASVRVLELESRPRTGNSVMYFGRGGPKRDSTARRLQEDVSKTTTMPIEAVIEIDRSVDGRTALPLSSAAGAADYDEDYRCARSFDESTWFRAASRGSSVESKGGICGRPLTTGETNDSALMQTNDSDISQTPSATDIANSPFKRTICVIKRKSTGRRSVRRELITASARCHRLFEKLCSSLSSVTCRSHRSSWLQKLNARRRVHSAPDLTADDVEQRTTTNFRRHSLAIDVRVQETSEFVEQCHENDRRDEADERKQAKTSGVPPRVTDFCKMDPEMWRPHSEPRLDIEKLATVSDQRRLSDVHKTADRDQLLLQDSVINTAAAPLALMSSCSWTSDDHLSDSTASTSGPDRNLELSTSVIGATTSGRGRCTTFTPLSSLNPRDSACPLSDTSICSAIAGAPQVAPIVVAAAAAAAVACASMRPPIKRDWSATSFRRVQSESDVTAGSIDVDNVTIGSAIKHQLRNMDSCCSSVEMTSATESTSLIDVHDDKEQTTSRGVSTLFDDATLRYAASDIKCRVQRYTDNENASVGGEIAKGIEETDFRKRRNSAKHRAPQQLHANQRNAHQLLSPSHVSASADSGLTASESCGAGGNGFATFPLLRQPQVRYCSSSTAAGYHDDRDVIANLMITHSGEPMCVGLLESADGSRLTTMTSHSELPPLSLPVTVPMPTSFHQVGSLACQQLIGASDQRLIQQHSAKGGSASVSRRRASSDGQSSTRSSSDNRSRVVRQQRVDRRRPAANAGNRHRYVDWSSSSETGGSNGDAVPSRLRGAVLGGGGGSGASRGQSDSLLEADISAGSSFDESTIKEGGSGRGLRRPGAGGIDCGVNSDSRRRQQQQHLQEQQERKLGRNWRLSQSPLMLHQQATYCVNSDKQLVRLDLVSRQRRRHHRGPQRRPLSAEGVLMGHHDLTRISPSTDVEDHQQQQQSEDESWRQVMIVYRTRFCRQHAASNNLINLFFFV
jgi:hypothetical protein